MRKMLAVASVSIVASTAHADVGPPPSCPAGLQGAYDMGHYCAAIACTSDDQCGGEKCIERSVCLRAKTGSAFAYEGECTSGSSCDAECMTKRVCTVRAASADPSTPPGTKHGCGCEVPGSPDDGAPFPWIAGAIGVVVVARRSSRKPRARSTFRRAAAALRS